MSYRDGDEDLRRMIRALQLRIERLENQASTVRRNDIRLGDLLISWDGENRQMTLKNLATTGPYVVISVP